MRPLRIVSSTTTMVIASLVAACGDTTAPGNRDQNTVTVNGIRYSSIAITVAPSPLVLADSVSLLNITSAPDSILVGGCAVLMRAYQSPDRAGSPVYDHVGSKTCPLADVVVRLDPGATARFAGQISAAELQNAGVSPGHYWFTAVVRLNGNVIELTAGDGTT